MTAAAVINLAGMRPGGSPWLASRSRAIPGCPRGGSHEVDDTDPAGTCRAGIGSSGQENWAR